MEDSNILLGGTATIMLLVAAVAASAYQDSLNPLNQTLLDEEVMAITALHVDGRYLRDTADNIIHLHGYNLESNFADCLGGDFDNGYNYYDSSQVDTLMSNLAELGVNCIRVMTNAYGWEDDTAVSSDIGGLTYRAMLKDFCDRAAAEDIYVIIVDYTVKTAGGASPDQDRCGYSTYAVPAGGYDDGVDETAVFATRSAFVTYISSRIVEMAAACSNYLPEVWNEPYGYNNTELAEWQTTWNLVIAAARAGGYTGPIIAHHSTSLGMWGTPTESYRNLNWTYDYPLTDSEDNIVVSFHVYRGYMMDPYYAEPAIPYTYSEMKAFYQQLLVDDVAQNYPVICGEIGARNGYERDTQFLRNSLQLFNEWGIHYTAFELENASSQEYSMEVDGTNLVDVDLNTNGYVVSEALTYQEEDDADVHVTLSTTQAATNNLQLGFQLDGRDIEEFVDSTTLRSLATQAGFKYVRFFHHRYAHYAQGSVYYPVTAWNNVTKTGTWNWTETDDLINKIIAAGMKPVVCLMYKGSGIPASVPSGMTMWSVDSDLPDPDQYAAYCSAWVARFGNTVEYEIANEMMELYYWSSTTLVSRYVTWWSTIASAMRQSTAGTIKIGDECPTRLGLDEFTDNGVALDFVAYHKYDSGGSDDASTAELFVRAGSEYHHPNYGSQAVYTADEIRNEMGSTSFPVVVGEANINWDYNPSDSRIQEVETAVWAALSVRYQSLNGLRYWLWWDLWGDGDGGATAFSMIEDTNTPWYSYHTLKMYATHSGVGDPIYQSTTDSVDFQSFFWSHAGKYYVWVIHKGTGTTTFKLDGIKDTVTYSYVDSSHRAPATGTAPASQVYSVSGYRVMLFEVTPGSEPEPPTTSKYTLTILGAGGCTSNPPAGTYTDIPAGETFNVLAVVDDEDTHVFRAWRLDGVSYYENPISVYMNKNRTLQPIVEQLPAVGQYTLTMQQAVGGSTDPDAGNTVWDDGTVVTLTATPDNNWSFSKWTVNGSDASTSATYDLTVDADKTVRAFFTYVEPQPGPTPAPSYGTVTASKFESVLDDTRATLASTPAPTFDSAVSVLENVDVPTFTQVYEALKKAKV